MFCQKNSKQSLSGVHGQSEQSMKSVQNTRGTVKTSYEVESILDSRLRAGKLEFFVNWKGYGYEENSWVRKCNVNAP